MRYKTIRNTKLFNKILRSKDKWKALFTADYEVEDKEIPVFAGQLDHITVKTKGVYYDDTGCNGRDFSFVIRPEIEGSFQGPQIYAELQRLHTLVKGA